MNIYTMYQFQRFITLQSDEPLEQSGTSVNIIVQTLVSILFWIAADSVFLSTVSTNKQSLINKHQMSFFQNNSIYILAKFSLRQQRKNNKIKN